MNVPTIRHRRTVSKLQLTEAGATDTYLLSSNFIKDGVKLWNMDMLVNTKLSSKDILEDILESDINVPDNVKEINQDSWVIILVKDGTRESLDKELPLGHYGNSEDFTSEDCFLVFESNGPTVVEESENLPKPGVISNNVWPLRCRIMLRDGTVAAEFTTNINVTLPAQSIVDVILQASQTPPEIRTSVESAWRLIFVHEDNTEDTLPEDVMLCTVATTDILAGHVHLKVAIVD